MAWNHVLKFSDGQYSTNFDIQYSTNFDIHFRDRTYENKNIYPDPYLKTFHTKHENGNDEIYHFSGAEMRQPESWQSNAQQKCATSFFKEKRQKMCLNVVITKNMYLTKWNL